MDLIDRVELLIKAEESPELQAALIEQCKRDPIFFFNTFLYTTDPRKPGRDLPFNLYPYQEEFISELVRAVEDQVDIGVEKSRDMGVTWCVMGVFLWGFLFKPGWVFHCGSKREQEVCNAIIDPDSTLFGKFRYMLYKLPRWMRPKVNDKKLSILNEDNDNIMTGESANTAFGRSRRYTAILLDELAFWENAEPAYEGCADTTNCRIAVSTPFGESNLFYKIMHNPENETIKLKDQEKLMVEKGYKRAA